MHTPYSRVWISKQPSPSVLCRHRTAMTMLYTQARSLTHKTAESSMAPNTDTHAHRPQRRTVLDMKTASID